MYRSRTNEVWSTGKRAKALLNELDANATVVELDEIEE